MKQHSRRILPFRACACLRHVKQAILLPFNHAVQTVFQRPDSSLVEQAQQIGKLCNGGTKVSAPVRELLLQRQVVDTFIGITDNVEWVRTNDYQHGFLPMWYKYKSEVAPHAKVFLVTIAPYQHAVAPDVPDIHFIYGWNEQVLSYIALTQAGGHSQLDAIARIDL